MYQVKDQAEVNRKKKGGMVGYGRVDKIKIKRKEQKESNNSEVVQKLIKQKMQ